VSGTQNWWNNLCFILSTLRKELYQIPEIKDINSLQRAYRMAMVCGKISVINIHRNQENAEHPSKRDQLLYVRVMTGRVK
jgi:hypothetical protein